MNFPLYSLIYSRQNCSEMLYILHVSSISKPSTDWDPWSSSWKVCEHKTIICRDGVLQPAWSAVTRLSDLICSATFQVIERTVRNCWTPAPTPKLEEGHLWAVYCPFILHIHHCRPYQEALSFIRIPMTHHPLWQVAYLTWIYRTCQHSYWEQGPYENCLLSKQDSRGN
jgi:hypothetical protein